MPSARASPPRDLPNPMLARLARELPEGAFAYEPKWDGLRCIAAVADATRDRAVHLRSRHGRPLTRYFPDVVAALAALPPVDGELVVHGAAGLDFEALLLRVHPSASRVERLAREKPATFVALDLLARGGASLVAEPLARPLAGHPWEHGFGLEPSPIGRLAGSAGRWDPARMSLDWTPLAPERVVEVGYDQLDGFRFRHPARLVRWRPDREPRSCELAQLREPP